MEKEKKSKKGKILIIIQIILGIILIFSLYKIGVWFYENHKTQIALEEINMYVNEIIIKEDNGEETSKINVDFAALKNINEETKGYLKVNNTKVEYPVVQTSNNDFYLRNSFDKAYNEAGWIFADYKNKIDGTDKNLVIYGHNREDDSMFGSLSNTLSEEWYNNPENMKITLVTENGYYEYEIFSIYTVSNEEYYITTEFQNNLFSDFIQTIKNRSIKDFGIEVLEEDNILTLSTCYLGTEKRMVVHAKLIK